MVNVSILHDTIEWYMMGLLFTLESVYNRDTCSTSRDIAISVYKQNRDSRDTAIFVYIYISPFDTIV